MAEHAAQPTAGDMERAQCRADLQTYLMAASEELRRVGELVIEGRFLLAAQDARGLAESAVEIDRLCCRLAGRRTL